MPVTRYALDPGGAQRLEISHGYNFKNLVVKLDGLEVGRVDDPSQLKDGRDFALSDGSTLRVTRKQTLHRNELVILRNGKPLPGSSTHPGTVVKTAAGILVFVAVINVAFGLFRSSDGLDADAIGMIAEGLIYAFLAWRVSKRSLIALGIAVLLYAADTVFTLMSLGENGGAGAHNIVIRVFVFIALFRAFGAIRDLKAESERGALPSPG